MVLVAMRENEAEDIFALLNEVADVGQDQIDTRQVLFGGERDAAIHDHPLPAALIPDAVDRKVHPDLADAAERCEYEFGLCH